MAALHAACTALAPGGLLSVLCYTGHPGGAEETEQVIKFAAELGTSEWTSFQLRLVNRPSAPLLIAAYKR